MRAAALAWTMSNGSLPVPMPALYTSRHSGCKVGPFTDHYPLGACVCTPDRGGRAGSALPLDDRDLRAYLAQ